MALLTPAEVAEQLTSVEGWTLDGTAIRKEFTFADFPEAVLFVSALVPGAALAFSPAFLVTTGSDQLPVTVYS